jgi:hypothetical protein
MGTGQPTGKFLPTHTHACRNLYLFVWVRDSRAHGCGFEGSRGYENPWLAHRFGRNASQMHTRCQLTLVHLPRGYCQAPLLSLVINDNKKKAHPGMQPHARGWVFIVVEGGLKYITTHPRLAFEGKGGGQEVTDDNDDDCRRRRCRLEVKRKRN